MQSFISRQISSSRTSQISAMQQYLIRTLHLPADANDPEHRVSVDAHAQPFDEVRARFTAKGKANRTLDIAQPHRGTSVTASEILRTLGENALLATSVDTPQPTDANAERNGAALPW
ncbi:hypothetical protein PE061_01425 [Sphingosinicella microcystinivorans]|nr:hypothetical protein [Sphingosinicella microcystinivorans]WBX84613.1 hypothetical protein PE061_01425 [Sphingosinicella microcystinivorans]